MDDYIDAIIKIGNSENFLKLVELNIMQPLELKEWMVKRVLYAWGLLLNEAKLDT